MCELFALCSRTPVTATFSLDELARHGGETASHADGWGVAFFDRADVRLVREAEPAASSACLRFVREHAFASTVVVAHLRKATRGDVALCNTQPFAREVGGRMHVFAHNGDLPRVDEHPELALGIDRPIGSTDSEYAFCTLLERLRPVWRDGSPPLLSARLDAVRRFANAIATLGPANFIYADGDAVFVHGHRRTQLDGTRRAPGLHVLARRCEEPHRLEAPGVTIVSQQSGQEVVLVASVPLTREPWLPLDEGEILVLAGGQIVARVPSAGMLPA